MLSSLVKKEAYLTLFDSAVDLLISFGAVFFIVSYCFLLSPLSGTWGLPLRAYNLAWESSRTCGMRLQGHHG
jgi:hypothetical protein